MKILAIMGSPLKKGHGFKVVKQIEEILVKKNSIDFEYLYLKDVNLEMCRGCFACIVRGEKTCPIKDDREKIEKKMLEADGVIFYSPVYGMNVSALMKKFIDRFAYNGHHPRFHRQQALFVTTTGGMGIKETLKALSFIEAWGFNVIGKIGIKHPPFDLPESAENKNQNMINTAASKLYSAISSASLPKPKLNKIYHFIFMKQLITSSSVIRNAFPGDFNFWKENGWLEKESRFFYPARLNFWQRFCSLFIKAAARFTASMMTNK